MVYIYRKIIGNKEYYYLRASVKKNGKLVTKDIRYLGSDLNSIKNKLKQIPSAYSGEIRKTYKTINRFIEANSFLEKAKSLKLKRDDFLANGSLHNIEACKLHWQTSFKRLDKLSSEETLKNFIIEFAFNTASIEGNTISLKEAQNLLLENLTPKNRTLREVYDLQNTEKVFNKILQGKKDEISHKLIISIHDSLLENIDTRKGYRTTDVRVIKAGFKATPAPYVKTDMELLLKWYKDNESKLHPFVLASLFHHKFEKIHPFMDGNGRTGRMLLNYNLLKKGYPPVIVRKKNRIQYLTHLQKADKCGLTEKNKEFYTNLIEFNAKEFYENYWNLFL